MCSRIDNSMDQKYTPANARESRVIAMSLMSDKNSNKSMSYSLLGVRGQAENIVGTTLTTGGTLSKAAVVMFPFLSLKEMTSL
jgi:hypothetical protein